MSETLFLRLHGSQIEWLKYDDFGHLADSGAGDDDKVSASLGEFAGDVIVVVPGEDVLLTAAQVPSRQARQIVQAVPYVVEEELAADVEESFFAVGKHLEDGSVSVSVVAELQMIQWLDRVRSLGVEPSVIVAESELLTDESCTQAIVDGARVLLGSTGHRGLIVNTADLPLAASLLAHPEGIRITASGAQADALSMQINELEASDIRVQLDRSDVPPLQLLAAHFNGNRTNLLQGRFKVEKQRSPAVLIWRSAAALAGVAFVLHMLLLTGQGWYLSSKAAQYEQEAQALYKSIFPNDRNVRDVRRRWNSHLGRSSYGSNPFLALFSQSSRGLTDAGLTLQGINFNESRGDLILQVVGSRSELLVQYAGQLSGQGLDAEIGTISQEDAGVRGSIKVRMGGS